MSSFSDKDPYEVVRLVAFREIWPIKTPYNSTIGVRKHKNKNKKELIGQDTAQSRSFLSVVLTQLFKNLIEAN